MSEFLEVLGTVLTNTHFYANIIAVTPPILFAALGCAVAEKADMTMLGMEGVMSLSSFVGVMVAAYVGGPNPILGMFAGMITGAFLGWVIAFFNLKLKVNIVLVGIAMNLFGSGFTAFFLNVITGDRSSSTSLLSGTLPVIEIPFVKDIPIIGDIIGKQNLLTWIAFISIAVVSFLLFKTKLGLRIRAVGENSQAAESVGISSVKTKTIAMIIAGALGGLGGVFMAEVYVPYFTRTGANGRGFIGKAACSMGNANPLPTAIMSIVFGFFYALANYVSSTNISEYLTMMWPYIATIIAVVIYSINIARQEKKRLAGLAKVEETEKVAE